MFRWLKNENSIKNQWGKSFVIRTGISITATASNWHILLIVVDQLLLLQRADDAVASSAGTSSNTFQHFPEIALTLVHSPQIISITSLESFFPTFLKSKWLAVVRRLKRQSIASVALPTSMIFLSNIVVLKPQRSDILIHMENTHLTSYPITLNWQADFFFTDLYYVCSLLKKSAQAN